MRPICTSLGSDGPVELRLDHRERGFHVRPFVSVGQELSVVEVVGAECPAPQGVALLLGVEAKAKRRDVDEAVKEAIDDDAEATGCCLGPAIRRHGSPPPGPRTPSPCPARVAPYIYDANPLSNNRFRREHFFLSLSQSLRLISCVLDRIARPPGASTAERRDADETVKEAIDDCAEPTGCNLGSAIRRHGRPRPGPRTPAPCPARVAPYLDDDNPLSNNRFRRERSFFISLSQSLRLIPASWTASPGRRRLDVDALKVLTTATYQQSIYIYTTQRAWNADKCN